MPTLTAAAPASERIGAIIEQLQQAYPNATCALDHTNAFELLVATILSAQCTDERVNKVTPALFARFPTPFAMAEADITELEELIRSTGFFRNKAKNIQGASQRIVAEYGGEVPGNMADLLTLPGVARKTANVVLGTAYGIADGVVVDTHVKRLSNRLALTQHDDPEKIEKDLMALVPREHWVEFAHMLILHGRQVCDARKPRCSVCTLSQLCPSAQL
ncbi:MAG: endonuclease III [Chloroflexi bacterium]|nr:MAG: endonuclease III [Chloroflexota bacterium]